jgi:hypothetical protein
VPVMVSLRGGTSSERRKSYLDHGEAVLMKAWTPTSGTSFKNIQRTEDLQLRTARIPRIFKKNVFLSMGSQARLERL